MKDRGKYSFLPWLAVNRPISVLMGLLTVLVLGAIAYTRIPVEMMPSGLEGKRLSVRIDYPNSTPLDTLDQIVRPLEDILGTITGVERVSTSAYGTSGRAYIYFHNEKDMKEAYAEVKDRLDRLLPDLPEDVDEVRVYTYSSDDKDIIEAAMTLGEGIADPEYFVERYIQPALERIEGVGEVDIQGIESKELRVAFDQKKLKAHNIDIYKLANALRGENYNLSSGKISESGSEYWIRSVGRIESPEELGELIVDRNLNLKLKEVAKIYEETRENRGTWRLMGEPSFGIELKRSSEANIVDISNGVKKVFARFERSKRWPGIEFHTFYDQGDYILESIANLKMSALWGSLFSFLVLMVFLRSLKVTLTITMAIPLSLLCSITLLYFIDWSMNMLTMMGLLVSVGLVVDNAIVMVENIHSKREKGLSPRNASLVGASEVGLAVTMATLTTMIVFVPLLLMGSGGTMKFFMKGIGVPVGTALVASLIIALVLIPAVTSKFSVKEDITKKGNEISRLNRLYQWVLAWVLRDRMPAMIVVLIICGFTAMPIIEDELGSGSKRSSDTTVDIRFTVPSGLSKEEVGVIVGDAEAFLDENAERYDFENYTSYHMEGYARLRLNMKSESLPWYVVAYRDTMGAMGLWEPKGMQKEEVIEDIIENLEIPPGTNLRIGYASTADPTRSFSIYLYGDDTETLYGLSEEVVRRLQSVEGLLAIETDVEENNQELGLRIDRDKAVRLGINPRDISSAISYQMRGSSIGYLYKEGGIEIPIRVKLDEDDRQTLNELKTLTFKADDGTAVPLENLTSTSFRDATRSIRREARKTSMRVRAIIDYDDTKVLYGKIDAVMQTFDMPEGYRWDKGGSSRKIKRDKDDGTFMIFMMVVFVVFLMGILFESFIMPLAVLANMLLALIGVVWMSIWTNTPVGGQMGMLGSVLLGGIVVNNGIVLIDLAIRLMKEGYGRTEALMEASRQRFRPIWITSLTTIFGMVPMALGGAKMMDDSYAPMGRVIIAGLFISTFLTVIAVPLFYVMLDDMRNWFQSWMNRIFFRKNGDIGSGKAVSE